MRELRIHHFFDIRRDYGSNIVQTFFTDLLKISS